MKKWFFLFALVLAATGLFAYLDRGMIRDAWANRNKPVLPVAARFTPSTAGTTGISGEENTPVEGGVATSQHYILVSSPTAAPKAVDPFEDKGPLPGQANLDVPFMSQAPNGNWDMPYQEACEEASAIMVDAYYRGITDITPAQADKAINALVDYENKTLGFYKDTNAEQTAGFIKGYFKYQNVVISPLMDVSQLKRAVANGYPVMIPAAGKLLPNPNFKNGGPLYHMLIVKGYTQDKIITNDPGTRLGADFLYTPAALLNAAHDWNGGDVTHGAPVMIVVLPNP